MMDLVVATNCPFCHRCSLALLEKGAAFETVTIDLSEKERFKDLLSPYVRVPVLWSDGRAIWESSIINEYLEEILPAPPLMPDGAERRAEARFWIDFCNTRFMPAYFNLLKERNPAMRGPLKAALMDHLQFIETVGLAHLSQTNRYWMGEDVSLVDLAFYPFFERFVSVEIYRDVAIPDDHQRLHGWLGAMRERHSVRKLAQPREYYIEYFRKPYADA
ncbi:MAG: glutathione S-transferase family protein [Dongiaceae bacterium]